MITPQILAELRACVDNGEHLTPEVGRRLLDEIVRLQQELAKIGDHYRAWQAAEAVGAEVDADNALTDLDEAIARLPPATPRGGR